MIVSNAFDGFKVLNAVSSLCSPILLAVTGIMTYTPPAEVYMQELSRD